MYPRATIVSRGADHSPGIHNRPCLSPRPIPSHHEGLLHRPFSRNADKGAALQTLLPLQAAGFLQQYRAKLLLLKQGLLLQLLMLLELLMLLNRLLLLMPLLPLLLMLLLLILLLELLRSLLL